MAPAAGAQPGGRGGGGEVPAGGGDQCDPAPPGDKPAQRPGVEPAVSIRALSAATTASARSSSRKSPRVPVVPEVVATM
jgi:hypothetical protein